jgi:hypothetical protein
MGPIEKPWSTLSLVESPDNPSRDHQKEKRGSPSVDSPGKICKLKDFEERLTKKVLSLRRVNSMFPRNGTKMLSLNLYLSQSERLKEGKSV